MNEQDWHWLENLPYYIQIPLHQVTVVHAGFVPNIPFNQQDCWAMTHMRNIVPASSASSTTSKSSSIACTKSYEATELAKEGINWAMGWEGPDHVVFGHDAVRGLQQHPFATGLDTGCCYGKQLTAYILPTREIVSVQAHQVYTIPVDRRGPTGTATSVGSSIVQNNNDSNDNKNDESNKTIK